MSLIVMPNQNNGKPGEPQQCPFCGFAFRTVKSARDGKLIPVQDAFVVALEPIANIYHPKTGEPILTDPEGLMRTSRFHPKAVVIPHQTCCPAFANLTGIEILPLDRAAGNPPPVCKCGHPWIAHMEHKQNKEGAINSKVSNCQFAECSCEGHRVEKGDSG